MRRRVDFVRSKKPFGPILQDQSPCNYCRWRGIRRNKPGLAVFARRFFGPPEGEDGVPQGQLPNIKFKNQPAP